MSKFDREFDMSGSPPRMRGKVNAHRHEPDGAGITPAHAGKSAADMVGWMPMGDHPRACGEKTQEVTKYKAYDILHA